MIRRSGDDMGLILTVAFKVPYAEPSPGCFPAIEHPSTLPGRPVSRKTRPMRFPMTGGIYGTARTPASPGRERATSKGCWARSDRTTRESTGNFYAGSRILWGNAEANSVEDLLSVPRGTRRGQDPSPALRGREVPAVSRVALPLEVDDALVEVLGGNRLGRVDQRLRAPPGVVRSVRRARSARRVAMAGGAVPGGDPGSPRRPLDPSLANGVGKRGRGICVGRAT